MEKTGIYSPKQVVIQLNDTHPQSAILELLRFFSMKRLWVGKSLGSWLEIHLHTRTTHSLPEALETWEEGFIWEGSTPAPPTSQRDQSQISGGSQTRFPDDESRVARMSIVSEGQVRMAFLSVVASRSVNGVAALHTKLLKENLLRDFADLYPDRFNNKTNGITPRRWLLGCNPQLAKLIDVNISKGWKTDLSKLRELERLRSDESFQQEIMAIKLRNKKSFALMVKDKLGIEVDPDAIFDSQIKRLHEYKRQHLNLLHILTLYRRLLQNPDLEINKRVFIFGAKAAPGYHLAKTIIHAINLVGQKINDDERINDRLKVVFWPNYGVSIARENYSSE